MGAQVQPIELQTTSHPSTAQFVGGSVAGALFSRGSPIGLACGVVNALWPSLPEVYFCGMDGFAMPLPADLEVMNETRQLLTQFVAARKNAVRAISLTPSQYCAS